MPRLHPVHHSPGQIVAMAAASSLSGMPRCPPAPSSWSIRTLSIHHQKLIQLRVKKFIRRREILTDTPSERATLGRYFTTYWIAKSGPLEPLSTSVDLTGASAAPMFAVETADANLAEPAFIFPVSHWNDMNIVIVELPAKAKTINKYLGVVLRGSGLVWPCPRPPGQERIGRSGRQFPDDLGDRPQGGRPAQRHRQGARRAPTG